MNSRLVTLIVVAVVALGAGLGIGAAMWAGGDHGDDSSASMDQMSDGMMSTTTLDEQSFLEQMVPHHESAIEMATLALEKGQRPQVRQLAQEIIDAQNAEIAQMRQWHQEWYGTELQASEEGHHASMDMSALEEATGEEFDRQFLAMMIPHHASAITMAEAVMMDSPRSEVEELAAGIIAAQAAEIGEMQQWRQQWFPPSG